MSTSMNSRPPRCSGAVLWNEVHAALVSSFPFGKSGRWHQASRRSAIYLLPTGVPSISDPRIIDENIHCPNRRFPNQAKTFGCYLMGTLDLA